MKAKKVVSLIASSTEIVCALGHGNSLVGRSHECDYPEWVKQLPLCTEAKIDVEGKSYEIDQKVKAILQEGLSVYRVFADQLQALKPNLILTQIQCVVCAVSEKDVMDATCQLIDSHPEIVSLNTNSLDDLWTDIQRVADALGDPDSGEQLIHKLHARMRSIEELSAPLAPKPRVAFIEWIDPLMSCGNWMPTLIEKAGGINLFGEAGKHSPWMTWEDLKKADPDIIIVSPCGFDIARSLKEMPALTQRADWKELKAVQNQKVFVADGNQYFNRPGPRLAESLEILAEIFHPEKFHFGHEDKAWIKLPSAILMNKN